MNKQRISAIVVTRNDQDRLEKCLSSLQELSDEIIVIDLESSDKSLEIAKEFGAKIISHKSVDVVEKVRQANLRHASHQYVIFLDPDEYLPSNSITVIKKALKEKPDYITIPRKNIIFDKWIQTGKWWPDYQIRIFKKSRIAWPKKLHAQPEIKGIGYKVPASELLAIHHHSYSSIDEYFRKNLRYAKSEALSLIKAKQTIKLKTISSKSIHEFISRYFLESGYKDGMHGFTLATLQAMYYFIMFFYYWELNKYADIASQNELVSFTSDHLKRGLSETLYWQGKIGKASIKSKLLRKFLR